MKVMYQDIKVGVSVDRTKYPVVHSKQNGPAKVVVWVHIHLISF